jgi:hypothetical protein
VSNERSVTTEFQSVYNFSVGETGLVFLAQRKVVLLYMRTASDLYSAQCRSYFRFDGEHVPGEIVPVR